MATPLIQGHSRGHQESVAGMSPYTQFGEESTEGTSTGSTAGTSSSAAASMSASKASKAATPPGVGEPSGMACGDAATLVTDSSALSPLARNVLQVNASRHGSTAAGGDAREAGGASPKAGGLLNWAEVTPATCAADGCSNNCARRFRRNGLFFCGTCFNGSSYESRSKRVGPRRGGRSEAARQRRVSVRHSLDVPQQTSERIYSSGMPFGASWPFLHDSSLALAIASAYSPWPQYPEVLRWHHLAWHAFQGPWWSFWRQMDALFRSPCGGGVSAEDTGAMCRALSPADLKGESEEAGHAISCL